MYSIVTTFAPLGVDRAYAVPVLSSPLFLATKGTSTDPSRVYSIELDPANHFAYASQIAVLPASTFGSTVRAAMVSPIHPDRVYVLDALTTKLGYVNTTNGALTTIGTVNVSPTPGQQATLGAFSADGTLYIGTDDDRLLALDPTAGAVSVDATSAYNLLDSDFAFDSSGSLIAFSANSRRFARFDAVPTFNGQNVTATEFGATKSIVYQGIAVMKVNGVERLLAATRTGLDILRLTDATRLETYTWKTPSGAGLSFTELDLAAAPATISVPEPIEPGRIALLTVLSALAIRSRTGTRSWRRTQAGRPAPKAKRPASHDKRAALRQTGSQRPSRPARTSRTP